VRNDIDLKYFKKRLDKRLEAIIAAQESQKKEAAPVELDQGRVGRLTRMDAMQQQAMSQAAARLADLERQRIQSARATSSGAPMRCRGMWAYPLSIFSRGAKEGFDMMVSTPPGCTEFTRTP